MKKILICTTLFATVTLACSKLENKPIQKGSEPDSDVKMITEKVTGTRESSSKVTISNDAVPAFSWTAGDNIAVHVSNGETHTYVFTSDAGASGASTAAPSASFTVVYPEGYTRDAFAVYPSTIISNCETANANYGQSGTSLNVKLSSSYTLNQVTGTTSPCPMIASNNAGSGWDFKQLCGLLRLTVHSIPPTTKRLEIDFDGKNVAGNFSIPSPVNSDGTSTIALSNAIGSNSTTITITKDGTDVTFSDGVWLDGLVLNIPLPTGDYTNITVKAYDALTDGNIVRTMTRRFAYTSSRLRGVKKDIPAVFSVSGSTRVIFSPGNLRATYTASTKTWTWSFAANDYDYIGNGGNNMIITSVKEAAAPWARLSGDGTVDLFGYSTSSTYYGIATSKENTDYSGDFVDWGSIDIDGKGSNYWRTMSCGNEEYYEWRYLTKDRTTGVTVNGTNNASYTKAILNLGGSSTVKGLILFPDKYSGPTENTSDITWGTINGQTVGFGTSLNINGWNLLKSEGCVFLPAAGSRYPTTEYVNDRCYYAGRNYGKYFLWVEASQIYWNMNSAYGRGRSVRLVHQVN